MSLNEKFGRVSSPINKVNIHNAPDTSMLQTLFFDLSNSTTGSQCDLSWQSDNNVYTLTVNHSRQSARASWKLYRGKGIQPSLLWSHNTNDVATIHQLISEALKQVKPTQSQVSLSALSSAGAVPEERRAVNINSNLSGKLRTLFIGAREDKIAKKQSAQATVAESQPFAPKVSPKRVMEFIDATPGQEIIQNLFMGQFGIFSYPTFLFFLEREYYEAIEHKVPLTLVLFKATGTMGAIGLQSTLLPVLQEIAKRIKHTQRKTDILAQYKDGEFAVLLPSTDAAGAKTFINRIEKALNKTALMPVLGDVSVKLSFGLATLGEHCQTLPAFLSYAEKALTKAADLEKNIVSDQDILAERRLSEQEIGTVDLTPARRLVSQLVSTGIFTYAAFLAFLEHEYYRALRKERDLLIMLVKIRINADTFDEALNMLPPATLHEAMRRIGALLNKRDIFAHYKLGNFFIMRPNTSIAQMQSLAKKLTQDISNEDWLTSEYPASSLCTRTQICVAKAHPTIPNLFCFEPAN